MRCSAHVYSVADARCAMSIPNLADAMDAKGPTLIEGRYSAQRVKRAHKWLIRSEVFVALAGFGQGVEMKSAT